MSVTTEQKAALRKSSPYKSKMRGAKRTIAPVTYSGTGNIRKLIKDTFPNEDKNSLMYILRYVQKWEDQNGDVPDVVTLKRIVNL